MKTTIVIEGDRVTVQVDDHEPIAVERDSDKTRPMGQPRLVQLTIPKEPVISSSQNTRTPKKMAKVVQPVPEAPKIDKVLVCINCGDEMPGAHPRAKYCKKPECKRAQVKAGNDRYRAKKELTVGAISARELKPDDPAKFLLEGGDSTPRLTENAPPAKSYTRSKCCEAKVEVAGGEDEPDEGGTRFYRCLACMNACDTYGYTPPFEDPWKCGACREINRLCSLHYKLEAEGREPPKYYL